MIQSRSVSVNIVIPVYKAQLTDYERIALTQCVRVLGNYPVWLAAPHTLDMTAYQEIAPVLTHEHSTSTISPMYRATTGSCCQKNFTVLLPIRNTC